ncbi:MAG: GNAT family N-acetyltransferase [Chloroflexota bacterium]|nr:GNAT family N-acetyltransferase [Chloroflexota bacterium]
MDEPNALEPCVLLEWDSEFWGFPIAQVVGGKLSNGMNAAINTWSTQHSIKCLYLLAAPEDATTARSAGNHGYRLVDERVTLGWFAPAQPALCTRGLPAGIIIRSSRPEDLPALQAIAWSSHIETRFFVDPAFPKDQARALYAQWISASCTGFADLVLVALLQGEVVGYCSCHRPTNCSFPGRIGLLAVAPAARGNGVARSLVEQALEWFVQEGAAHVTVVTQGRNDAALTLYRRCGFTVETRMHWYHRWFSEQVDERL